MYEGNFDLSISELANESGEYVARTSGHMDELTFLNRTPEEIEELHAGMAEYETDMAIQRADDAHAATLDKAVARAKELAGVAAVTVGRLLEIGTGGRRLSYTCRIEGADAYFYGAGETADASVDHCLSQMDAGNIAPAFGGYRVKGVALILAGYDRSKADALALARRVFLDGIYLTACLRLNVPGVTDERDRPQAATAA